MSCSSLKKGINRLLVGKLFVLVKAFVHRVHPTGNSNVHFKVICHKIKLHCRTYFGPQKVDPHANYRIVVRWTVISSSVINLI